MIVETPNLRPFGRPKGVTLIEALISIAVLAVAAAGAFAGLTYAAQDLKVGALRQYKMILLEAKAQRILTQDKTNFSASAVTSGYPATDKYATNYPPNMPIGSWTPPGYDLTQDLSPFPTGDLSAGAYFLVLPNGQITQLNSTTTPSVAPGTKCGDASLPPNCYCRETLLTIGPPIAFTGGGAGILPGGTTAMTLWTRVSKTGEPSTAAVSHYEAIIQ